ncbi:MAG: UDP-N-acetylmuramate--L-alanine ligase [Candidatus Uhrbacteria bacterium]
MLEGIQTIHFVGVGGIGVSAAAKWCLVKGKVVSGSDRASSPITDDLDRRGVTIAIGHDAANVPVGVQLVVYSPAVVESNVERVRGAELGARELSYPQFLGAMSKGYSTIAVSGTNGKSTTTAMLALMLEAAGYDPTVIVGSLVPSFPLGNLRVGNGRFFVVEACEYRANMLEISPEMIVLTNVEADHLDFYRDVDHIRETFQTFVDKLKGKGLTVWNKDDAQSNRLVADRGVTYGFDGSSDYVGLSRSTVDGIQTIETNQGILRLKIPGAFNAMNALAATASAMELGVPFETCARVLSTFTGIWRRFERVGTMNGAEVISDYGHHPTAIKGTIAAAREFFPGRRIVLCFQPHQHSRTAELFDEFVESIATADEIVVAEIYGVAGRTESEAVSSKDLVARIDGARYASNTDEAEATLREVVCDGDVVIVQGAGDIDEVARRIVR